MGFAPDSAHALPFAGFGQGSLLARNLTWGLVRKRTLPTFNDRGTLRGECLSVWGLEGPTSTSADLFYDREAQSRDESSLGKRFVAGGGPLDVSGSPCNIITAVHGHIFVEGSFRIIFLRDALTHLIIIFVVVVSGSIITASAVVEGFPRGRWNPRSFGAIILGEMNFGEMLEIWRLGVWGLNGYDSFPSQI